MFDETFELASVGRRHGFTISSECVWMIATHGKVEGRT